MVCGCPQVRRQASRAELGCLSQTYVVPLAGIDLQGIFIVNTTVLLWSVAKREKQEEDQKSCALLCKFLCSCVSSLVGP